MYSKKLLFSIILSVLMIGVAAFISTNPITSAVGENRLPRDSSQRQAPFQSPLSTTITIPPISATLSQQPLPNQPQLINSVDLSIPVGNGHDPVYMVVDSQNRMLYTLNYGLASNGFGNTISVYHLDKKVFVSSIQLHNQAGNFLPNPRSLTLDTARNRLYVISEENGAYQLTIVDTRTFHVVDYITDVEVIAPGKDYLYLANASELWTADPETFAKKASISLAYRPYSLALDFTASSNRLYLSRGLPWSIEIFKADTLTPTTSYAISGNLIQTHLVDKSDQLLFLTQQAGNTQLQTLDNDGPTATTLSQITLKQEYGFSPLTTNQEMGYIFDNDGPNNTTLLTTDLSSFTSLERFQVPDNPRAIDIDLKTGQIYILYPANLLHAINPQTGQTEDIFTAQTIDTALVNSPANRLYVLSEQGTIRVLNLETQVEIAQVTLPKAGLNVAKRKLTLDTKQQRLFISGDPIYLLNTESFSLSTEGGLRGQITLDSVTNRLYLTPPCQCQQEQCNTHILAADTLTEIGQLFPPQLALTAPCVIDTQVDDENHLLYAHISNGTPGSNSGLYFQLFDVSGPPQALYTSSDIGVGPATFAPIKQQLFVTHQRMNEGRIIQYQYQNQVFTQSQVLPGAQGDLVYDAQANRLYSLQGQRLLTLDDQLNLLSEVTLPNRAKLLALDVESGNLYLKNVDGQLLIVAAQGGILTKPTIPTDTDTPFYPVRLLVAPNNDYFRIWGQRLYRSPDEGKSWQILGWGLPDHPISDVAISPNFSQDNTIFTSFSFAGDQGGLYRSTDGGTSWVPTMQGLTDLGVTSVEISPTFYKDKTVFVTTAHSGIFRSIDGGTQWQPVNLGDNIEFSSYSPTIITISPYFATDGLIFMSQGSLLRSTDGGTSWVDTQVPAQVVAFSPNFQVDGLILADGRWRSTNRGQSWQAAASGLVTTSYSPKSLSFSTAFSQPQTVYLSLDQGYGQPLFLQRSIDAGRSWQTLLTPIPNFTVADSLPLANGDLLLTNYQGHSFIQDPAALDWGQTKININHLAIQTLNVASDSTLLVGNSAKGILKSTDGGQSWLHTRFPIRGNTIDPLQVALADDDTLFAGLGATLAKSHDLGESWSQIALPLTFSLNSLSVSPDFAQNKIILAGGRTPENKLLYSDDSGQSWQTVFDGATIASGGNIAHIAFSPNFSEDGRIAAWIQNSGLIRSTDGGQSWTFVGDDNTRYITVQALTFDAKGTGLYFGTFDGRLYYSDDDGQRWWYDLSATINRGHTWISTIAFDDENSLYLGTDVGVFKRTGQEEAWIDVSSGLPQQALNSSAPSSIQHIIFQHSQLYTALTEGGLFALSNSKKTWETMTAE